jgi:hypothetical protein
LRVTARLEPHRGELVLGEMVVPVADAGPRGELRVGGPQGPVLRPVAFGERTRVVARAASSSAPRDGVAAALLRCATVEDGQLDRVVAEIAALLLAGAGDDGPPFSVTLLRVAQGSGWTPAQIAEAEAVEIDRLAAALGNPAATADEWNRLVLVAEPARAFDDLRDELADTLLARIETPARAREPEPAATGDAWNRLVLVAEPVQAREEMADPRADGPPAGIETPAWVRGAEPALSPAAPGRLVAADVPPVSRADGPAPADPAAARSPVAAPAPAAEPVARNRRGHSPQSSPRISVSRSPAGRTVQKLVPSRLDSGATAGWPSRSAAPAAPELPARSPPPSIVPDGAGPSRLPELRPQSGSMLRAARVSALPRPSPAVAVAAEFSAECSAEFSSGARLAGIPAPAAPPAVAPAAEPAAVDLDLADALAQLLDEESDLRGLWR